jgi:hypothetical protein
MSSALPPLEPAFASPAVQKQAKKEKIKAELFPGSQRRGKSAGSRPPVRRRARVREVLEILDDGEDVKAEARREDVINLVDEWPDIVIVISEDDVSSSSDLDLSSDEELPEKGRKGSSSRGGAARNQSARRRKSRGGGVDEEVPEDSEGDGSPPELESAFSDGELLEESPFEQQQQQEEDVVRHGKEERDEESRDSLSVDEFRRLRPRERIGHLVSMDWEDEGHFSGEVVAVNESQFPGEFAVLYKDGEIHWECLASLVGVEDSSPEELEKRRREARERKTDAGFKELLDAAKKNELFDRVKEESRGAGLAEDETEEKPKPDSKKRPANFRAGSRADGDFKKAKLIKNSDASGRPPKPTAGVGQLSRQINLQDFRQNGLHFFLGGSQQDPFGISRGRRSRAGVPSPIEGEKMWFVNTSKSNDWAC